MPFYEYQCSNCGAHHEELQKITDPAIRKCPDCGRNTLRRLVSAPVFRLKGGGWYETDFKAGEDKRNLAGEREPPATDAQKETKPEAAKDAKPETPKDAKPETPKETPAAKSGDAPPSSPSGDSAKPMPAKRRTGKRSAVSKRRGRTSK